MVLVCRMVSEKPECGDIASRLYGHEIETANKDGALQSQYASSWTEVDTCIRHAYCKMSPAASSMQPDCTSLSPSHSPT